MKKLYGIAILLFITTVNVFAQTGQVFILNKLSKQDTLVSGWKFHTGDNQQWLSTAYDDTKWKAVDPGQDIQHFDELKKAGIAWIRVHIMVDSSLAGKTLAVRIAQYTASEIYLNGKLIAQYGNISPDPAKVKSYLTSKEPFVIKLEPGKDNLIAVRMAYQPGLSYISTLFEHLSAFAMYVNGYPSAEANYHDYLNRIKSFILVFTFCGGAIVIIFLIHLVYFLFDRSKKVNLYYALFCFSVGFVTLPNEIYGIERFGNITVQMWISYAEGLFFVIGMEFLLLTVYALFGYKHRRVFAIMTATGVASAIYMYFNGATGFFICTDGIPILFMLEGARVCIWAIRRQIKNAAFVLTGTILFVVLINISSQLDQGTVVAQLSWAAGLICFPIGMSFYLGVQSSLTNRKLLSMLDEVQTLSAQNLAQELEKQQILASQNMLLEKQVNERTSELNQSLTHLKQTQTQLIQSEKMASLGELTAGIAHEIQNPLNFVNNFSEVSVELLNEMDEELDKGEIKEAKAIGADLKQNLKKISHHGKRADFIVKGMLEHSRTGTGEKQLTDINGLADEFLKLSYHGLRAKDKSFNVEMITHFDKVQPKVSIVQQDIGHVLLNLFNNAFYAVNQKRKTADENYKPEVTVTTSIENNQVIIKVKDNGVGIPMNIKEKIMQPFFTTKPPGEGTGLGLSLAYEMVVKGHGGNIQVNSEDGLGSEFIISLPL